jgi:hypothetical protein
VSGTKAGGGVRDWVTGTYPAGLYKLYMCVEVHDGVCAQVGVF